MDTELNLIYGYGIEFNILDEYKYVVYHFEIKLNILSSFLLHFFWVSLRNAKELRKLIWQSMVKDFFTEERHVLIKEKLNEKTIVFIDEENLNNMKLKQGSIALLKMFKAKYLKSIFKGLSIKSQPKRLIKPTPIPNWNEKEKDYTTFKLEFLKYLDYNYIKSTVWNKKLKMGLPFSKMNSCIFTAFKLNLYFDSSIVSL